MPKHIREYPDTDDNTERLVKKRKNQRVRHEIDIENLNDSSRTCDFSSESGGKSWFTYDRLQNITFATQFGLLFLHMLFCGLCVSMQPKATFMIYFHGVVSPVCAILYLVGGLSIVFGTLSVYRRKSIHVSIQRQAQWYRRYMRCTKFVFLLWFLSTCTSIFGCWMYYYAINLERTMPAKEIYASRTFKLIIKQILVGVSRLQSDLEEFDGISSDMAPLKMIKTIGQFYHVAAFVITIGPCVLLFICVQIQRKYYAYKFSID